MKVLGIYLPQYHEVKENNEWWGQGYTEWNAVKMQGHYFGDITNPVHLSIIIIMI